MDSLSTEGVRPADPLVSPTSGISTAVTTETTIQRPAHYVATCAWPMSHRLCGHPNENGPRRLRGTGIIGVAAFLE